MIINMIIIIVMEVAVAAIMLDIIMKRINNNTIC